MWHSYVDVVIVFAGVPCDLTVCMWVSLHRHHTLGGRGGLNCWNVYACAPIHLSCM